MNKHLLNLLLFISLIFFQGCQERVVRKKLRNMMDKEVQFPQELTCIENGKNASITAITKNNPKLVVFIDSTECGKCHIDKLTQYRSLFDMSRSAGSFDLVFLLSPKKADLIDIEEHLITTRSPYPVYIDNLNKFRSDNSFIPNNHDMHTFYVDEANHIVLVGDPLYNESIKTMFLDITHK